MNILSKTQAIVGLVTLTLALLGMAQQPALAQWGMPAAEEIAPVPTVDSPVVPARVVLSGVPRPRGGLFAERPLRYVGPYGEWMPYDPRTEESLAWSAPSRLRMYEAVRGFPRYTISDQYAAWHAPRQPYDW